MLMGRLYYLVVVIITFIILFIISSSNLSNITFVILIIIITVITILSMYFQHDYYLFYRCMLDGLLRKVTFCFLCFCLEGNSPRFGLVLQKLSFDLSWF